MSGNKDGNMFGIKPVVGSKQDNISGNTTMSLLKKLVNKIGLGSFDEGFTGGFEVYTDKTAEEIGLFKHFVRIPYVFGDNSILAHLNTNYYHIHGESFVYPNHADGVTLTAGAGAWDLTGAITEVIPVDTLTKPFDLHFINVSTISANGTIQIDIYSGDAGEEELIASTRATRDAVQSFTGSKRIQIPQQEANKRISCRLSDSTAGALTCIVSFEGHFYG